MKKFKFQIRGNKYDVEILSAEGKNIELEVNGTKYSVELEQEIEEKKTPKLIRQEVAPMSKEKKIPKTLSSVVQIKTPLPGVVLKVLAKEGMTVKEGDILVVIEAMKMENKIMAEKAGVVKSVKVHDGDSVLENDVLVEIE